MELFEVLFDLSYLIMVVSLGVRLLLEDRKDAKMFGIMAIVLGLGDGFHLVPRMMAHLSSGGFETYQSALSWGQLVTSITMTVFYVLYYYYYRNISGDKSKTKDLIIYTLAIARIVLSLLPQNGWGTANPSVEFGIIRNIPFSIMGILLIIWTWKNKEKPGLKYMAELIFFSFLFYIPVVLWSHVVPAVGAFMIPKTIAYLLLVVVGYKNFIKEFNATSILKLSIVFLIMSMGAGVFYREFTKLTGFVGKTNLSILHVHGLALGFLGLSIFWLAVKDLDSHVDKTLKKPVLAWVGGLYFTLVTMAARGLSQAVGQGYLPFKDQALSGIAGLGHILLGVSIVMSFTRLLGKYKGQLNN